MAFSSLVYLMAYTTDVAWIHSSWKLCLCLYDCLTFLQFSNRIMRKNTKHTVISFTSVSRAFSDSLSHVHQHTRTSACTQIEWYTCTAYIWIQQHREARNSKIWAIQSLGPHLQSFCIQFVFEMCFMYATGMTHANIPRHIVTGYKEQTEIDIHIYANIYTHVYTNNVGSRMIKKHNSTTI